MGKNSKGFDVMIAYKLIRRLKDGSLSPLFINRKMRLTVGTWLKAFFCPTKGFSPRLGWHCLKEPVAPHLSMELATGEVREFWEVEIDDYEEFSRPASQGGVWFLAKEMKLIRRVQ